MALHVISRASSSYVAGESSSAAPSATAIISSDQQQVLFGQLFASRIFDSFLESECEALFSESGLTFDRTDGVKHTIRIVLGDDDLDQVLVEHFQSGDKYDGYVFRVYKDKDGVAQGYVVYTANQDGKVFCSGPPYAGMVCGVGVCDSELKRSKLFPFEWALVERRVVLSNEDNVVMELEESIGSYFDTQVKSRASFKALLEEKGLSDLYLKTPAKLRVSLEYLWQASLDYPWSDTRIKEDPEKFRRAVGPILDVMSEKPDLIAGTDEVLRESSFLDVMTKIIKESKADLENFEMHGSLMFSLFSIIKSLGLSLEEKNWVAQIKTDIFAFAHQKGIRGC